MHVSEDTLLIPRMEKKPNKPTAKFDRSTVLVCKIKNHANRIHVHNMHFNLCFHMLIHSVMLFTLAVQLGYDQNRQRALTDWTDQM